MHSNSTTDDNALKRALRPPHLLALLLVTALSVADDSTQTSSDELFVSRLDHDVRSALSALPHGFYESVVDNPIQVRRQLVQLYSQQTRDPVPSNISVTDRLIEWEATRGLRLVIYEAESETTRPALLWFHGGGHVIGTAECDDLCIPLADALNGVIVSVDYPLAPESTYEAHIAAGARALAWLAEHAHELDVDPGRIAIGGGSAGGGLAAGLALYNRDTNGPPVAFQLLLYPMLDNKHDTPSGHEINHPGVWNRAVSLKAWALYLGNENDSESVSPYAAPSRSAALEGLPPAYVTVGTEDLFRDEAIDYAQRLMAAGVHTGLEVHPGLFHGASRLAPQAAVSRRLIAGYTEALRRALSH